MIKRLLFVCVLLLPQLTFASLNLELTKGIKARVPMAVLPFTWHGSQQLPPVKLGQLISNDLQRSGQFSIANNANFNQQPTNVSAVNFDYWRKFHLNALLLGQLQSEGNGQYQVTFVLVNLFKNKNPITPQSSTAAAYNPSNNPVLLKKTFTIDKSQLRHVGHQIANMVYHQLTGGTGYFTSRIAYVAINKDPNTGAKQYQLMTADYDGYNPKSLLVSSEPISSPAWSPNRRWLAYVSYENSGLPAIYKINVNTLTRQLLVDFPDAINGSPAWSPNSEYLAFVLAKTSTPNLYIMNLKTGNLTQLTQGWSIDTEPSWSADSQSLLFTSNRNGSPQVYQLQLQSKQIKQLTYNGAYNTDASFSSTGKQIVLLHGNGQQYNIALLDLVLGQFRILTKTGLANSPSFSPNGYLILYSTFSNGHECLALTSIDGSVNLVLPNKQGVNMEQPVWS